MHEMTKIMKDISTILSQPEDSKDNPDNSSPTDGPASQPTKPKRIRGNAIQRLRKASARTLRDNSSRIANALLERALVGDVSSAKLLVTFVEKPKARKVKKKRRNLAAELAAQPQWVGPPADSDDAETWGDPEFEPVSAGGNTLEER
jgi:hypothetical protein